MSIDLMRSQVKSAYPGKKWSEKVLKMSSTQIVAVYYKLVGSKKLK